MPQLKITGGITARVSELEADSIAEMRWGKNGGKPTADPNSSFTIENVGTFQVKDVRAIIDDDTVQQQVYAEINERNRENYEKCLERREKVKGWNPIQKSERMLKTYCYLLYRARGNKGDSKEAMFRDPLYSELMRTLVKYFEANPKEHYAPREIYQKLIPTQKLSIPSVSGWKTFAEFKN